MRALFARFPRLVERVAHIDLGVKETPVERVVLHGRGLFIKRDDLSAEPLGGNKVRALEFLLAGSEGADAILTVGSTGSTHALATAIQAQRLGKRCEVITWPQEDHDISRQTARRLAEVATVTPARSPVDAYARVLLRRVRGNRHWVPAGGSSARGALGHVSAGLEIARQLECAAPNVTHLVVPLGSGGTVAGLLVGLSIARARVRILAVRVVPKIVGNRGHVLRLAWQTHRLVRRLAGEDLPPLDAGMLHIEHDWYGGAYGRESPGAAATAHTLRDAGGPLLDGTYSAKAFAPALQRAEALGDDQVLFWLTFDARWLLPDTLALSNG